MALTGIAASLLERVEARRARTGVLGLGYVGLPLAVEFGRSGFRTTGIDLDERKVRILNEGRSYIEARFIELAGHVNASMPHFVVGKIADALNTRRKSINGSSILVAGVAYKRDSDDIRESPSLDVMTLLRAKGARVAYADPDVPVLRAAAWPGGIDLTSVTPTPEVVAQSDCVVILTDHRAFDYEMLVEAADVIVDTRNAIRTRHRHVFRLGASATDGAPDADDMVPAA